MSFHSCIKDCLSHSTSLGGKIGLSSLGELGVKHGGVDSKSYSTNDKEGKGKLLSSRCGGSSSSVYLASSNDNLTVLAVSSRLEGGDEVAYQFLVGYLVGGVISVVRTESRCESVCALALSGSLVKFFTDLLGFGGLGIGIVSVVTIIILHLCQTVDAVRYVVGSLEKSMGKLHGLSISVSDVVLNVQGVVKDLTRIVGEDSNLDLGSL
mmetsp:Transcript_9547/g.14052  ORF Transcript_9547/g.14052 Transcript_9547/m.14052 type:complete len:209 (+) Transcript_9547:107-733(+)